MSSQFSEPPVFKVGHQEYNEKDKLLSRWVRWISGNKGKRKSLRYLERVKTVAQAFLEDEFSEQADIVKRTGISKSAVSRIVNELEEIDALERKALPIAGLNKSRKFKYKVRPKFIEFLDNCIDTLKASTRQFDSKNTRLTKLTKSIKTTRPSNPEELNEWCRNGWFRIHGFQRKWILKNYKPIDDENKWLMFTCLINDCTPEKLSPQSKRKIRIGRNGRGFAYIIKVWSRTFKVNFQLQFLRKCLVISLPKNESIYISWDEFNEDLEHKIVQEINNIVSRALKIYDEVFKQQVSAYDDGWVGEKKQLRPEVAYVDPDGTIHKVYEVEGATYIEGLGFWIDNSLQPAPEAEFDSIETASKFKKAIETLASGELTEKIESVNEKMEDVKRYIEDRMEKIIPKLVDAYLTISFTKLQFVGKINPRIVWLYMNLTNN